MNSDDQCGDIYRGNNLIRCQMPPHSDDESHQATVTRRDEINYGSATIKSVTTDTVTWEDDRRWLTRQLDRATKKEKSA